MSRLLWLMLGLAQPAMAGSVYINGVRADAPPPLDLKAVNVRIDAQGNIWIDAPGYQVQVVGGPPPAPVPMSTLVWYLVSEDEGSVGGVVDVYVNDRYVRRLQSGQSQVLVDLTSFVQGGTNKVQFVVRTPPTGRMAAYIGGANPADSTLRIDAPPVTWRSTGSQQVQEFSFTALP